MMTTIGQPNRELHCTCWYKDTVVVTGQIYDRAIRKFEGKLLEVLVDRVIASGAQAAKEL